MLRIKELRTAQGITQVQLAKLAGISRSYLAEMENGTKVANTRRISQVARVLGVSDRDLYAVPEGAPGFLERLRSLPQRDQDEVERLVELLYARQQRAAE